MIKAYTTFSVTFWQVLYIVKESSPSLFASECMQFVKKRHRKKSVHTSVDANTPCITGFNIKYLSVFNIQV